GGDRVGRINLRNPVERLGFGCPHAMRPLGAFVMPGLVPGIHDFVQVEDVGGNRNSGRPELHQINSLADVGYTRLQLTRPAMTLNVKARARISSRSDPIWRSRRRRRRSPARA